MSEEPVLNDSQISSAQIVNLAIGIISLIGETFMIITYIKYKNYRVFSMKLVISLIVSDLLSTISSIIGVFDGHIVCLVQSVLQDIGFISAVYWFVIISFVTYHQVSSYSQNLPKKYNAMLLWSIVISLLYTLP